MKETKSLEAANTPDYSALESPRSAMHRAVWASRLYLSNRINNAPSNDWLASTFDGAAERSMFLALMRVWDYMLVSSDEQVVLHTPECGCLSIHEQALITAVRCLQSPRGEGYVAAMASVLPLSAVRLIRPAVQDLARALSVLERQLRGLTLVHDSTRTQHAASQRVH